MNYLEELEITKEEIAELNNSQPLNIIECLTLFPGIVKANFRILKNIGIVNYKEVFLGHPHMFFQNPDKFQAIFDKYDHADLVRCLEKNGAVIEKL